MPSPVDLIKERLGIADVVGSYIKLEKAGSNLKAKCPFHNEKTPSFFVSPARGSFYCFGCSTKGDIFSFVQQFEGLDFVGALKILAGRAGVDLKTENPKVKSERERLYAMIEEATVFFEKNLGNAPDARVYLDKRGLKNETLESWRIGYALPDWRTAFDHLKRKGYSEKELETGGIVKKTEDSIYDRFRSRIIFPIFDSSGRPVAFSGRILGAESQDIPKYLNSPETPLFSKSRILYGFDKAKSEIRRLDYSILVEGQVDLVMSHQEGFKNTIAASGTALTADQINLIKRLSSRILMVYDSDKAGVEASLRSANLSLSLGMEVKVAGLPKGYDPADLLKKDIVKWKECIKSSKHIVDFYLDIIVGMKLDKSKTGKAVLERILPLVASVESKIEQSRFVKRIVESTGIREQAIYDDLARISKGSVQTSENKFVLPRLISRKNFIEPLIFGLVFWQEAEARPKVDTALLKKRLAKIYKGERFSQVLVDYDKNKDELIFQAESYYSDKADLNPELEELLLNLEEDLIKGELELSIRELEKAEKNKDTALVKKLLTNCQTLSSQLNLIKSRQTS